MFKSSISQLLFVIFSILPNYFSYKSNIVSKMIIKRSIMFKRNSSQRKFLEMSITNVNYENFDFKILKESIDSKARTAVITTPHGNIETPNFVFCATKAAMKSITPEQLKECGSQLILSNTYHLMLTPGSQIIEKMGGLQKFTAWNGPMLTDSGGYQIFSMGFGSVSSEIKGKRNTTSVAQSLISITEDAAIFRSYVDGSIHHLTPEKSIEIQRQLGADLIVVLDECTPFNVNKDYTEASMHRSHRWATRSLKEFIRSASGKQALYGIIQGGVYDDLRQQSCEFINQNSFFGTAIGGSLGATKQDMHKIVSYTRNLVRNDRPVHLLGIGGVRDIFHGVKQGIDTFDCVHPTRLARHAGALVLANHWNETIFDDFTPIQAQIDAELKAKEKYELQSKEYEKRKRYAIENNLIVPPIPNKLLYPKKNKFQNPTAVNKLTVREHVDLSKGNLKWMSNLRI